MIRSFWGYWCSSIR